MLLDATNKKIQVKDDATATTTEPSFVVDYVDVTSSGGAPTGFISGANDGVFNGTTAVDAVASPGSGIQRRVREMQIINNDTVVHTITVIYNNNTTLRTLQKFAIAAGQSITYVDGLGWTTSVLQRGLIAGGTTGQLLSKLSNTDFDVAWSTLTSASTDIQAFTTPGTSTWTKPSGAKAVFVVIGGGGGGGASGSSMPTGGALEAAGGGGGGGGSLKWGWFNPADLSSTETVTVGDGGVGGIALTSAQTNNVGLAGSQGANSTFGSHITAYGGGGGGQPSVNTGPSGGGGSAGAFSAGGTGSSTGGSPGTGGGVTGSTTSTTPSDPTIEFAGGAGGGGQGGAVLVTTCLGGNAFRGGGGGGAGGGRTNTTNQNGAAGGQTLIAPGGAGGAQAANSNASPGSPGLSGSWFCGGSGGGGGGSGNSGNGGTGGVGGTPCGGGGGGGGTQNNNSNNASGAGGKGGPGFCIVITLS